MSKSSNGATDSLVKIPNGGATKMGDGSPLPKPQSGLSPYPDPDILPFRAVHGQQNWNLTIGRKSCEILALRVWTPGATLSHLEVHLAAMKLKVGVTFTPVPPWNSLTKAREKVCRQAGGGEWKQLRKPTLSVPKHDLVCITKGTNTIITSEKHTEQKSALAAHSAPGPGYFIIEFNNKGNLLRKKVLTNISWRIDNDNMAPCYAMGSIPVISSEEKTSVTISKDSDVTGSASKSNINNSIVTHELSLAEATCVVYLRAAVEIFPQLSVAIMPGGIPLRHDTETLLRFARARKLQRKQALIMLKKHVAWRATLPKPNSRDVQEEIAKQRVYYHDRTATGHRLVIASTARFLMPTAGEAPYDAKVVVQMQVELLDSFAVEDAAMSWAGRGRTVHKYSTLVDFTGNTKGLPPMKYLGVLSKVMANNYPERTAVSVIYPVPSWVCKMVNGMLKFLVDPVTRKKIHLTSTLADTIKYLELTGPENLPEDISNSAAVAAQEKFLKEAEASVATLTPEQRAQALALEKEAEILTAAQSDDEGAIEELASDDEDNDD